MITSISPGSAGPGSTVTITGSGFGSKRGSVFFGDGLGEFDTGAQCGGNPWSNTHVIVKVPLSSLKGIVNVSLERVEPTLKSKSTPFTVTDAPPGPAICSVIPDNGPPGTPVTLAGSGFGQPGIITIGTQDAAVKKYSSWQDTKVSDAVVPQNAKTGSLELTTKQGAKGNAYPFLVNNCVESGCPMGGAKCCTTGVSKGVCVLEDAACAGEDGIPHGKYEWIFSTGKVPVIPTLVYQCGEGVTPSPAPWAGRNGGAHVCINAKVTGVLNIAVLPMVYGSHVVLEKCTEKDGKTCGEAVTVPATIFQGNEGGLGFEIVPSQELSPGATYRVTLSNAISSLEKTADGKHIPMIKDPACAAASSLVGQPSACFTFTTAQGGQKCAVKDVLISPSAWTTDSLGIAKQKPPSNSDLTLVASGIGNDACVLLNTNNGPWTWGISTDPNPVSLSLKDGGATHLRKVDALKEHTAGKSATIRAEYKNPGGDDPVGTAQFTIALAKPKVLSVYPLCNKACVNGGIGAIFNTKMSTQSFMTGAFLHECTDESCKTINPPY